jgi:phage terminase small subunit
MSDIKLTQKQETFCLNYIKLTNATEAAIVAGYSKKTARVIAGENLSKPAIKARIEELRKKIEGDTIMSIQERMQRLAEIARARLTDFMELGQDGSWVNIGPETPGGAAIQEIHSRTEYDKDTSQPTVYTSVKLHDPIRAIDLLNKMTGAYPPVKESIDITTQGESIKPDRIELPLATVDAARDILIKTFTPSNSSN